MTALDQNCGTGREPVEIEVLDSLRRIDAAEWDGCACPEAADGGRPFDPFTTHRFLAALENSGSVGPDTGWLPRYLVARLAGTLIGVAPMYVKFHSQGEYIFDHNWAHAYESAGGRYYPKLQIAVPFTPATGRRLLVLPEHGQTAQSALVDGAVRFAVQNDISSLHITFCEGEEVDICQQMGLMHRLSQQFHWCNAGYDCFDDFLASLSSRKRKSIRRERGRARAFGGQIEILTGEALRPEHWDVFWRFYQDTGARKWGHPYLTRSFFDLAHETLRHDVILVLARSGGRYVAGALNFAGRETLFGRYWGCLEHHPFLHFELCYYQAIDWAIVNGLKRVEAGAQGEHKLARGYLPTPTHSLHWIGDRNFARAVKRYLTAEQDAVAQEIEVLTDYGPFRSARVEEWE